MNPLLVRSILVLHGLTESHLDVAGLAHRLSVAFPDRHVEALSFYDNKESWMPMIEQVAAFRDILAECDPPCDVVAHSQGALIARSAAQFVPVGNMISLAGPQCGIIRIPESELPASLGWLADVSQMYGYAIFYQQSVQSRLSIANYWRDVDNNYLEKNVFLPYANGEVDGNSSNLIRAENFTLAIGKNDGVLYPYETAIFGCCTSQGCAEITSLIQSDVLWKNDKIGLRKLQENGRLHVIIFDNAVHGAWLSDDELFQEVIVPALI